MLPSRFQARLLIALALAIVSTVSIVGTIEARRIERAVRLSIENALRDHARLLAEFARPVLERGNAVDAAAVDELQARIDALGSDFGVRLTVIAADGRVLADSAADPASMQSHATRPEILALRDGAIERIVERRSDTVQRELIYLARAVTQDERTIGFVRTARSRAEVDAAVGRLWTSMSIAILAVVGLAGLTVFLVSRQFTAQLRSMTRSVSQMATGEVVRRLPVAGSDELGSLAIACNSLAEQLAMRIDVLDKERREVFATLRSMVEGVVATDENQRVLLINDSARELLSIEAERCVGQPFWSLCRVARLSDILDETVRREHDVNEEITITSGLAADRVLELRSSPLRSGDGRVRGAVVVCHDVTELRRLEQVRRDFVSNVSHELKTPLTAIRGFVDTMLDDPELDVEVRTRFLGRIREQADRLTALVRDQLTLARLDSPHTAPVVRRRFDYRPLVQSSIALVEPTIARKQIRLTVEIAADPIQLEGDPELLRQIADNLLDNAAKYTPERGRIGVRVWREDGFAALEVEDSGIGLSREDQQRVFERFYRVDRGRSRDVGGTGLGLSIVRNATVAAGGEVSVRSELGRGSCFSVRLPLADDAAAAPKERRQA